MKMIWDITNKCNLKCKHCGAVNLKQENLIEKINLEKIINYISEFIEEVHILGGEPLVQPNIFTCINLLKKNNIKVKLITNGQFDDSISKKLIESNVDFILISIDGLEEENDKIRGNNSWDKSKKFLDSLIKYRELKNINTKIGVNFVINNVNYRKIKEFIDYFNNIDIDTIQINPLILEGNALENNLNIEEKENLNLLENITEYIVEKKIEKVIINNEYPIISKYLNEKYGSKYYIDESICTALIDSIYCNPDGNIYPCRKYNKSYIGISKIYSKESGWDTDFNLFDDFLKETSIVEHRKGCGKCEYKEICKPCPLKKENEMPKICQIIHEKMEKNKIPYFSKFKLIKPYSIIEKNGHFFMYNPKINMKTEYTYDGFRILKELSEEISISDLAKKSNLSEDIIYKFLLQEKEAGKICEIKNDELIVG